jgi:hypothetical protein
MDHSLGLRIAANDPGMTLEEQVNLLKLVKHIKNRISENLE